MAYPHESLAFHAQDIVEFEDGHPISSSLHHQRTSLLHTCPELRCRFDLNLIQVRARSGVGDAESLSKMTRCQDFAFVTLNNAF